MSNIIVKVGIVVLRNELVDSRLARQLKSLKRSGIETKLFSVFSDSGQKLQNQNFPALSAIRFKYQHFRVLSELRAFNPSLIIAHEPESLRVVSTYVRKFKTPLIYDAHEYYPSQRGATSQRVDWVNQLHCKNANIIDNFVTVSPGLARLYASQLSLRKEITVLPNASEFLGKPAYDGRLHEAINATKANKILLYHGGLWADRGLEYITEVGQALPSNWRTVFIGYGPLGSQLKGKRRITVLDAQHPDGLQKWTAGATFAIIPYPDNSINHRYCLPNKLWEYAAAGCPIVSRDLPDISKIISKWKLGTLIQQDVPPHQAAKTISAISDSQKKEFSENCIHFCSERSWHYYEPQFLSLVTNLL